MATVKLDRLTKIYPGGVKALDRMSLEIENGEFVVFVGPSGCGKSTALRMIAGLEEISGGELFIDGTKMTQVHPRERDIAMVFQNYALYPHMSVRKNIAYPLKIGKVPKQEVAERVGRVAEILQLTEYLDRKPGNLSGGQRQRVAMGRAIVREPAVFLMDEPLSNLDAKLRVYMRSEIARIQRELDVTTIYVTHDQVEAMTMGDRVVVLRDGVLQQGDKPSVLYNNPANIFVAGFIGSPAMNLLEADFSINSGGLAVTFGQQALSIPRSYLAERPALCDYDGRRLVCGVRPDDVYDPDIHPEFSQRIIGEILLMEELGSETVAHLDIGVARVESGDPDLDGLAKDANPAGAGFLGRFNPKSTVEVGQTIGAAIDVSAMHFFDPQTGNSIRG